MNVGAPLTGGLPQRRCAKISAVRFDRDRHVRSIVSAEAWPSLTPATTLSPPERPKSGSMPSDHGFGLDDDKRLPPASLVAANETPEHMVLVLQSKALLAAIEHLESVAESGIFEDPRFAGAERSSAQVQNEFGHPDGIAARRPKPDSRMQ